MFIAIIVGGIAILMFGLWWIGWRKPRPSGPKTLRRPASQVLVHPKKTVSRLPDPEEMFPYDLDGERMNNAGPSPELLARMDAAGMNTTYGRYDDYAESRRRGTHRSLGVGEVPVSRERPDDAPTLLGVALGLPTPEERTTPNSGDGDETNR